MRTIIGSTQTAEDPAGRGSPLGRLRTAVLLLLVVAMVAACGGSSDDAASDPDAAEDSADGDGEAADAGDDVDAEADDADTDGADDSGGGDLEPLSLAVAAAPVPPSMTSLALGVALAEGMFDDLNLTVDVQQVDSGLTAFRGLEAGQVDVSVTPVSVLIPAAAQGTSVRAVYALTERIQHQVVVPADEISECADLEGRVLAIDQVGGFVEGLTRAFLATCDLTPQDVTYATIAGSAMVSALVEGQAFSGVLQPERIADMVNSFPETNFTTLANFAEVLPDLHSHVWGVTQGTLDDPEGMEAIVRFVAAMIRTNEFILDPANEDAVVDATVGFSNISDPEVVREALPFYVEGGLYPTAGSPGLDEAQFDFTINFAIEQGNLEEGEAPAYDDLVDLRAYEAAVDLVEEG